MPRLSNRLAAVALLSAVAAAPAGAAVVSGTIVGTILGGGGTDTYNLFGGGDMSGRTVSIAYAYDVSHLDFHIVQPTYEYYRAQTTATAGAISVSITIGSYTVSRSSGATDSSNVMSDTTDATHSRRSFYVSPGNNDIYASFQMNGAWTLGALAVAGPYPLPAFDPAHGSNYIQQFSLSVPAGTESFVFSATSSSTSTASEAAPAPEPASLALLGVGILGAAAARRRGRS